MSDEYYVAIDRSGGCHVTRATRDAYDDMRAYADTDNRRQDLRPGSGRVFVINPDDHADVDADQPAQLAHSTRLARKHTAAVAELAEVDPQQAYEFFEWLECIGAEKAPALLAKIQGRPEPVDEVGKLRALVDALMPVWEAAVALADKYTYENIFALTDTGGVVDAARPRVAAALAGVGVDEEKERMRAVCEAACEYVRVTSCAATPLARLSPRGVLQDALDAYRSSAPPQDKGRWPEMQSAHWMALHQLRNRLNDQRAAMFTMWSTAMEALDIVSGHDPARRP